MDDENVLHVITVQQEFCQKLLDRMERIEGKPTAILDPVDAKKWISSLSTYITSVYDRGYLPIILCAQSVRPLIKGITERDMPGLVVLSIPEIDKNVKIESLGEINVI